MVNKFFDAVSSFAARRPWWVLGLLAVVTVVLIAGMGLRGEQADTSVFLPDDSEAAGALDAMEVSFPDTAGTSAVTVLHRGDGITPAGLAQIDAVVTTALADPIVAERLAVSNPVASVAAIYAAIAGVDDVAALTQADIDEATATIEADPALADVIDGMVGAADGQGLVTSSIRLRDLGDPDALHDAELHLADLVETVAGPLDVRATSAATNAQEQADDDSMTTLMIGALAVIAVLLFVFFRTGSDLLLALLGLGITVAGTLGAQGLLGPNGLGVIGDPNTITTMVPIMLIGLVVDYAIQSVSHYRELRTEGRDVATSVRGGLRGVLLPLGLAAVTTMISFLTNVASPIPANKDFGIVAAFGVFFGLFVMLTLIPSTRAILDRRKEARGQLRDPRPMSEAIPGAGSVVEAMGRFVTRRPAFVLVAVGVVTVVLGVASASISTEFDSNDFLASDGPTLADLEALDEAFGGQTETVTMYVTAELTDDRTLRNLVDITEAFSDDLSRPTGAAGNITDSLGLLFTDWSTDTGVEGDNFDPELTELGANVDQGLTLDPDGVQLILDRLQQDDPTGFAQVAVNNRDGTDETILRFNGFVGDQERTQQMVDDIEGLWFGDRSQITVTSSDIVGLEVTNAMTDSQTSSIIATILAALAVLVVFFWATDFKPMLAVIAVAPIGLVLLWVLGTMALTGIPYNVITALITALSIGIGVDYTIHVIHRFTEELEQRGNVEAATSATLATTGSALIGSALTTALGFGVLLFSPLAPFQQFGLVTAITILFALIAAIAVVPPMLVVWAAYHQWRAAATLDLTDVSKGSAVGPEIVVT